MPIEVVGSGTKVNNGNAEKDGKGMRLCCKHKMIIK